MRKPSLMQLIILALFFAAGGILGIYKNSQASYRSIYLNMPQGTAASIYKDLGGDGAYNYNSTQPPVMTSGPGQIIKIKVGTYDIIVNDAKNELENSVFKQTVSYGTKEITIRPAYNKARLSELLQSERPSVLAQLYSAYPLLRQNYNLEKDGLYMMGDWYGAYFVSKNNFMDSFRIIEHKENGTWKITTQPFISIGSPSHPDIPIEVIEKVDSL